MNHPLLVKKFIDKHIENQKSKKNDFYLKINKILQKEKYLESHELSGKFKALK